MRTKKPASKSQQPKKGRSDTPTDLPLEKRLGINSPLRKTFSELFYIYAMMHFALGQASEQTNPALRQELASLWKDFELTKLPIRLAYRDVKEAKARNKRQFYFWLRNQREIKMIVEHEENNFHLKAA